MYEENSMRFGEPSGSWKLNNSQWSHWAGRLGSDGHECSNTETPDTKQIPQKGHILVALT